MNLPKRNKFDKRNMINIENRKYINKKDNFKPVGLWYACGNDWYNFILYKMPKEYLQDHKYVHEIQLHRSIQTNINEPDKDKILIIKSFKDFFKFTDRYGYYLDGKEEIKSSDCEYLEDYEDSRIDWNQVSLDFGGIEICPYLEKVRYIKWYYGWDVASGCIWNTDLIRNIKLIYEHRDGEFISCI